ncbi:FAD-dependent oxidoreductase [Flavobacterium sp. TAB 87]|uniref:FAD-dependent oxidoreductase n=1 Tax=Flavobacterium sp. TAB 87 TaxID=1729581 RepID=UPI00076C60C9|nr:FAD-dependent oxidoreductase [Flavobacterium sp. TAB 87]KVV16266.1 Gamma-glutamylputrescine oxidoreductase [Flavobacterium sp. TAB 87]
MNTAAKGIIDSNRTSGINQSFWTQSTQPIISEKLNRNIETDILIIGGGISGITTAYSLLKAGRKVTLVEDGYIGSGETGRTTAHLTCALDQRYFELEKLFGKEKASLVANSHLEAIQFIENTLKLENIDCNFKRVPGYLFLSGNDSKETLTKEYEATKIAGLLTEMLEQVPDLQAEEGKWCIKFPEQGQIHIMKYLKGLTDAIIAMGGSIFTETRVEDVSNYGAKANGFDITANHIVVATNTPINDMVVMHTKQYAYRTYVVAAKIPKGSLPYALWWDTGDQESKWVGAPYHYARLEEFDEQYDLLILGGEDHKVGQAESECILEEERYKKLIDWSKKRFPAMMDIIYKWSGQVVEPVDSLPYIGKNPGNDNIYIITGHSGNGITNGTLGGIIITDIILGNENAKIDLFSPSRITLKAAKEYLQEVGNMVFQYGDWITKEDVENIEQLLPGQGGIVSTGIKKIAAYRDEMNNFHTCSAVCPHLGAILHWNAEEKSFDCPAHGSRFTAEGIVINGPANCNLKKVELKSKIKDVGISPNSSTIIDEILPVEPKIQPL